MYSMVIWDSKFPSEGYKLELGLQTSKEITVIHQFLGKTLFLALGKIVLHKFRVKRNQLIQHEAKCMLVKEFVLNEEWESCEKSC